MRIGEFEDAVGKQALARREAVTADLARLGVRLAEPGHGATGPAVAVPDSVVLSPEARAAHLPPSATPPQPAAPFPSPASLIAALKDLQGSGCDAARRRGAVARLAVLIRTLGRSLPPELAAPPGDSPAADALVRALLGGSTVDEVRTLALRLLASAVPDEKTPQAMLAAPYERAAVAIFGSLLRVRAEIPVAPAPARPGALPPELMALLGQPPAKPLTRRPGKRRSSWTEELEDQDQTEDSGRK